MSWLRIRARPGRRAGLTALGLAISVVSIWVCLQSVDIAEVGRRLGGAELAPLGAFLVVLAAQTAIRAWRWSFLLPRRHGVRIPARRALAPLLVGYLGNAVLPARLGEPTRALLVARREDVPGAAALGSVVLERVIDMAVLALLLLPAAWLAGAPRWIVEIGIVAAAVAVVVLVILSVVGLAAPARWVAALATRLGTGRAAELTRTAASRIAEFATGVEATNRRPAVGAAVLLTVIAWLLDGTLIWLAGASLGVSISLADAIVISGVAVLGTAVPSAPGYVGTFELAASAAAVALGVPPASALAVAIVGHAMTLLPMALAGVVALSRIQRDALRTGSTMLEASPAVAAPAR